MRIYEHPTNVIQLSHGRTLYVPLHEKSVYTREQMQAEILRQIPDATVLHYCDVGNCHGMAAFDEDDATEFKSGPAEG